MSDNVTAFEITNFDGFFKSVTDEAFNDSALLVGKSFFRKTKTDMNKFRKHIVERKDMLIPKHEVILKEIEKCVFSTVENKDAMYILPKDMEYVINKVSDAITYNIMSHLTDVELVEMCYSPKTEDIIFRLKK